MTIPEGQIGERAAPTCARHPDRVTWVSCGRCGKPLCPDCMRHGPVGVRCDECLRPPGRTADGTRSAPRRVGLAVGVALGMAVAWLLVLLVFSVLMKMMAPNLLLAGLAGGTVGRTIWRVAGRTWDARTLRWAVALGVAMPLFAVAVLLIVAQAVSVPLVLLVRVALACVIGGFFAWLGATSRHEPTARE